jgi:rod shape-determining protein MreC
VGSLLDMTEMMERNIKIENQNKAFSEIAWIQSHKVRGPLTSLMGLVNVLQMPVDDTPEDNLIDLISIAANELDKVIHEIVEKSEKVVFNEDTIGQLKKLENVLDLAGRGKYKVVSARVIGKGSSATFSQTITIDSGSNDGVMKDMTVIGELGLVGVVKSTTSTSAIVLLMSDPTFRIGVRIARSQSIGVLLGEGDNNYTLQLLDPSGSIEKDDVLLSLGSDNNKPFVPGVPVGYVKSVNNSRATLTQEARVNSYSNLGSLGVVSVIISSANGGPKDALIPMPRPTPTTTIYVTQPPVAETATSTTSKAKN